MKSRNFETDDVEGTSPITADTEFSISHSLTRGGIPTVPRGFLITQRTKAGSLYLGSTPWTTSKIYLKSNVINLSFILLLFA